jgi:hypothetical protein
MEIPVKTLLFLVSAGLAAQTPTPTPVALVNPGFEAPYKAVNLNGGTITGQVANGWSDNSRTGARTAVTPLNMAPGFLAASFDAGLLTSGWACSSGSPSESVSPPAG